jgi:hypothetical protein
MLNLFQHLVFRLSPKDPNKEKLCVFAPLQFNCIFTKKNHGIN